MGNISDEKTQYATNIVEIDQEKKFLQEAQEALQDYDNGFVFRKPSCVELPDKVIECREMDLFELYICVLLKELKHGYNIRNIVWNNVNISGRQIVYPYIKEIWDVIAKEYAEKTCSKIKTGCVFSRRVKRCGKEPQSKVVESKMVTDLIFYINKEEKREKKYDDLIAFMLMHSKDLYDMMIKSIENTDLLNGIDEILRKMLEDYFKREIKSDAVRGMYEITEKKKKKALENLLYNGDSSGLSGNLTYEYFFDGKFSVCSKWKGAYDDITWRGYNYE